MSTSEHKAHAPQQVKVAIITVSTTRSLAEDRSGRWIADEARRLGHAVADHRVVTDDRESIVAAMETVIRESSPDALLLTGGTGISPRDVTIEAVRPLLDKELSAFGPLFAQLSYGEIGSAALLSRATAGVKGNALVFCMPGSLKACQLACNSLIFPELGHLVKHLRDN